MEADGSCYRVGESLWRFVLTRKFCFQEQDMSCVAQLKLEQGSCGGNTGEVPE